MRTKLYSRRPNGHRPVCTEPFPPGGGEPRTRPRSRSRTADCVEQVRQRPRLEEGSQPSYQERPPKVVPTSRRGAISWLLFLPRVENLASSEREDCKRSV